MLPFCFLCWQDAWTEGHTFLLQKCTFSEPVILFHDHTFTSCILSTSAASWTGCRWLRWPWVLLNTTKSWMIPSRQFIITLCLTWLPFSLILWKHYSLTAMNSLVISTLSRWSVACWRWRECTYQGPACSIWFCATSPGIPDHDVLRSYFLQVRNLNIVEMQPGNKTPWATEFCKWNWLKQANLATYKHSNWRHSLQHDSVSLCKMTAGSDMVGNTRLPSGKKLPHDCHSGNHAMPEC